MAADSHGEHGLVTRLLRGHHDTRVRATYRVVLALPFYLATLILSGQAVQAVFDPPSQIVGFAVFVSVAGVVFAIGFAGWRRYIDRRPLAGYGLPLDAAGIGNAVAGFGLTVGGGLAVVAAAAALGYAEMTAVVRFAGGSVVVGALLVFVGNAVDVLLQQLVYQGIMLRNSIEGLRARGLSRPAAAGAAATLVVAVFLGYHVVLQAGVFGTDLDPVAAGLSITVLGAIAALLYLQTGSLSLPIGVHAGATYLLAVVAVTVTPPAPAPTIFAVTYTVSGPVALLTAAQVPELMAAYLLVLAWLRWGRNTQLTLGVPVREQSDATPSD